MPPLQNIPLKKKEDLYDFVVAVYDVSLCDEAPWFVQQKFVDFHGRSTFVRKVVFSKRLKLI